MPITVNESSYSTQIKSLLHEIPNYYGQDCNITMVAIIEPFTNTAIKIDKTRGIVFGEKNDILLKLNFFASNSTTNNSLAVEFTMNFGIAVNTSWNDFIIHIQIGQADIKST